MINNRLFGDDIPIKVKKKLEARQLLAEKARPNETINSDYKDASLGSADHPYSDWVTSDSDFTADLSSRTPFVRMWTAVQVVDVESVTENLAGPFNPNNEKEIEDEMKRQGAAYDKASQQLQNLKAEHPGAKIVKIDGKYYVKSKESFEQTDYVSRIYTIGSYPFKEYQSNPNNSLGLSYDENNAAMQGYDEGYSDDFQGPLPPPAGIQEKYKTAEQILTSPNNANTYNKPSAGITSVKSETSGMLGVIKKTNINFEVHNFKDYDEIYNRFFLKPGARIFIDFGWSTVDLYDPQDLIDSPDIKKFLYNESDKNSGVAGKVTENQGDLEVLDGIVTSYDSKILENGSVQCSLQITSANSALLGQSVKDATVRTIQNILDHGVLYLGLTPTLQKRDRQTGEYSTVPEIPDYNSSNEEILQFNEELSELAYEQLGSYKALTPKSNAVRTGVFVNDIAAEDVYIAWGIFEDIIVNSQFGFGGGINQINEGSGLEVRLDSTYSFTQWNEAFYHRQQVLSKVPEDKPTFLMPEWWGGNDDQMQLAKGFTEGSTITSKGKRMDETWQRERSKPFAERQGYKGSYSFQVGKAPNYVEIMPAGAPMPFYDSLKDKYDRKDRANNYWDKYKERNKGSAYDLEISSKDFELIMQDDKNKGRIPLREVFINTEVIVEAFKKESDIKEVIKFILKKVNDDMDGLMKWELKTGSTDSELMVVDSNYITIQEKIDNSIESGQNESEKINNQFDKMFKFDIMSPRSIVKNYDISLSIPDGNIGNMYAIQGMSHDSAVFPIDDLIDEALSLDALDPESLSITYKPSQTGYRAGQLDAMQNTDGNLLSVYQTAQDMLSDNVYGIAGGVTRTKDLSGKVAALSEYNKTEKKEMTDEEKNERFEELVEIELERANLLGYKVCGKFESYFKQKTKTGTVINKRPTLLPIRLNLTIYGIASIQPGDIFRVSYLPSIYQDRVYFQTMKVSHDITTSGWETQIESQFRIRPDKKGATYEKFDEGRIILSPKVLESLNLNSYIDSGDGKGDGYEWTSHQLNMKSDDSAPKGVSWVTDDPYFSCELGYCMDRPIVKLMSGIRNLRMVPFKGGDFHIAFQQGWFDNFEESPNPKNPRAGSISEEIAAQLQFKFIDLIFEFTWTGDPYKIQFPYAEVGLMMPSGTRQIRGMAYQTLREVEEYLKGSGREDLFTRETHWQWVGWTGYGRTHHPIQKGMIAKTRNDEEQWTDEWTGKDIRRQYAKGGTFDRGDKHNWYQTLLPTKQYYMVIQGNDWAITEKTDTLSDLEKFDFDISLPRWAKGSPFVPSKYSLMNDDGSIPEGT